MSKKKPEGQFYSLQEVSKILRVSERSVFRYIHAKKLRASKIGYWRISVNDLQEFILRSANILKYIGTQSPLQKAVSKKRKKNKS